MLAGDASSIVRQNRLIICIGQNPDCELIIVPARQPVWRHEISGPNLLQGLRTYP